MSLHHMHQVGQRAANKFQMQSHLSLKPFRNHNFGSRRRLTVVAGEARSANRTKWTRQDAEQQPAQQTDVTHIRSSNGAIQQLADIDPHELVSVVLLQQQRQHMLLLLLLLQSDGTSLARLHVRPAHSRSLRGFKYLLAVPLRNPARLYVPLVTCAPAAQAAWHFAV
jgi:hypothetical protein